MTTDKAYELLTNAINQLGYEEQDELMEVSSMALEILYEKAKDYDNMLVVAMEKQEAKEESDDLQF